MKELRGLLNILSPSHTFYKFNTIRVRMLEYVYHMALR